MRLKNDGRKDRRCGPQDRANAAKRNVFFQLVSVSARSDDKSFPPTSIINFSYLLIGIHCYLTGQKEARFYVGAYLVSVSGQGFTWAV